MKKLNETLNKLYKKGTAIYMAFMTVIISQYVVASADDGSSAWNSMVGIITPWITRLGGAVILIGGIMWGLGFKSEDAEAQTRGIRTLVAGAIVCAVGASSSTFLSA